MSNIRKIFRDEDIEIDGKISLKISAESKFTNIIDKLVKEKEDIENSLLEAKAKYEKVISEIEVLSESILKEATEKAKDIEKKAYEVGYEQGLKNGYEDGFKDAYEKNIEKALEESQKIKEDGYKTLLDIRENITEYIKENKREIIKISISIAEQVLREKFEDTESINKLLENIIKEYSLRKDMTIKVNPAYINQFDITNIKNKLDLTQRIFVICDSDIEKGNVEIEMGNGKLKVGIDSVLDKIKSELL